MENLNIDQENEYFKIIDIPQRTKEWYEFRKGRIGASQVAGLMGISPWSSKLATWEEIVFGKEKNTNPNMERGIRLEPLALKAWNGIAPDAPPFIPIVVQSNKFPSLIASLDGWDGKRLIEIKCPRKFTEDIPQYYLSQMHHQMLVTNTHECIFAEYVDGELSSQIVRRDENFIQRMLTDELAFLQSIIDFRPPTASQDDWLVEWDDAKVIKSYRYKEISLLIDELEEEREELRKDFITDAPHPRIKCGDISIQRVMRKGPINYEQILKDYEITDSENYRKAPIETWRIS